MSKVKLLKENSAVRTAETCFKSLMSKVKRRTEKKLKQLWLFQISNE